MSQTELAGMMGLGQTAVSGLLRGEYLPSSQKIVGHASIETTNQHYFNQISEDVKRKVAAIDAVFEEILPDSVTHISPPSG